MPALPGLLTGSPSVPLATCRDSLLQTGSGRGNWAVRARLEGARTQDQVAALRGTPALRLTSTAIGYTDPYPIHLSLQTSGLKGAESFASGSSDVQVVPFH